MELPLRGSKAPKAKVENAKEGKDGLVKNIIRLLGYGRRVWKRLLLLATCVVLGSLIDLVPPLLTRSIVDNILSKALAADIAIQGDTYLLLALYSSGIVLVALISGALGYGERYSARYVSERIGFELRNELYRDLQRQSFSFYDENPVGQLIARATSDVQSIQRFLSMIISRLFGTIITFIGIFFIVFPWSPILTFLSLSIAIPMLFITIRFSRFIHSIFYRTQQLVGRVATIVWENINGVRVVRAFNNEPYEVKKFTKANQEWFENSMRAAKVRAVYNPFMDFLIGFSTVLVLWWGGGSVIAGSLSLGTLIAFSGYLTMLMGPIRMMGFIASGLSEALASAKRVFEILDVEPEVKDKPDAIELPPLEGHVRFENVSFRYGKGPLILKNVSFEVKPGQVVALLGATGSGKSTIIQLIPRFYDVTEGRITVDDYDIRDVKIKSLRSQIGIVLQENFLFSGTIKDNIAYGKPDATMEEIVEAAKIAGAHEFIQSFPDGYNTLVGERGVTLSGGQRQRIAIARALLMNPRILILDDSTSNVDVETEYEIQKAMKVLMKGRTTFVITQRVSTVRAADQIIVLDQGRIVEMGRHEELLAKGGLYARLYYTQLQGARGVEGEGEERSEGKRHEDRDLEFMEKVGIPSSSMAIHGKEGKGG
ncbi:MAG: ABC transporter ATP-binding protein [Candidatus Bathyarchaeia archaeon]